MCCAEVMLEIAYCTRPKTLLAQTASARCWRHRSVVATRVRQVQAHGVIAHNEGTSICANVRANNKQTRVWMSRACKRRGHSSTCAGSVVKSQDEQIGSARASGPEGAGTAAKSGTGPDDEY